MENLENKNFWLLAVVAIIALLIGYWAGVNRANDRWSRFFSENVDNVSNEASVSDTLSADQNVDNYGSGDVYYDNSDPNQASSLFNNGDGVVDDTSVDNNATFDGGEIVPANSSY